MAPALLQPVATLASLVAAWREAKAAEQIAAERRHEIEERIADFLPNSKPEERITTEAEGCRVTIAYKVTRKVDGEALQAAWDKLSPRAAQCFRWKAEVDTKEMRKVAEFDPSAYTAAARYIETKPAKPSVTIEPIEDK